MLTDLCSTCLSPNRTLYKLGYLSKLYDALIPQSSRHNSIQICFECKAVLDKCDRFVNNAQLARDYLVEYSRNVGNQFDFRAIPCFSNLNKISELQPEFHYTHTDTEKVKTEIENIFSAKLNQIPQTVLIKSEIKLDSDDDMMTESLPSVDSDPLSVKSDVIPLQSAVKCSEVVPKPVVKVNKVKLLKKVKSPLEIKKLMKVVKPMGTNTGKIQHCFNVTGKKVNQLKVTKSAMNGVSEMPQRSLVKIHSSPMMPRVVLKRVEDDKKKTQLNARTQLRGKIKDMLSNDDSNNVPTAKEILARFRDAAKTYFQGELYSHIEVSIMTDSELSAYRESLKTLDQFTSSKYRCDLCIIGYYTEQQYEDHIIGKHTKRSPTDIRCEICMIYVPPHMFSLHYGRHRVLYKCQLCESQTNDVKTMKVHMSNSHTVKKTSVKQYYCRACDKVFKSVTLRNTHRILEHSHLYPRATYTCDECGRTLGSKTALKIHFAQKHSEQKMMECNICQKTYKCDKNLATHIKYAHESDPSEKIRCEECAIDFSTPKCLQMHLTNSRKHADPSRFKHICHLCGKGFVYERQMNDHIDYIHKGITEYVCQYCTKMFSSSGGLHKHVKFVHEGVRYKKNKTCLTCGKSFTSPKTLKEHQNIHNGSRPFKCVVCGDTFKQSAALYTHKRLVHQGYKVRNKKVIKCD